MQRQQLLSSVIKLFYCPKTKVIATSGVSEGANGNIKQKTNKGDHFQNNCRVPCWIWWRHSRLFRPPALIGNPKHPATEKTNQQQQQKKTPGAPLVACISQRSGENENYCCSTSPFLPTREHLWGSADCLLSE